MKYEKMFTGDTALKDAVIYSYGTLDLGVQGVERRISDIGSKLVLVFQFPGYDYKHIYVVKGDYIFNFSPFSSCLSGDAARPVNIKNGELVNDPSGPYRTKAYIKAEAR